jgi:hypothetical protein
MAKQIGNTIAADINNMRLKMTESNNNDGVINNLVDAVNALLSIENIKQKSRKSISQIWASTEIRTMNKTCFEDYGVFNQVTEMFNNNMEEELISLNGMGRIEIIEMVKSLEDRATDENKIKIANKGFNLK